ncbi:DNA-binding transcriptional LysR family regulator [Inquilinus ginsengisoli]|uniref:DNA-binding transcriptional LysR family regulator n=1 Tax=Inquilinus ginsengisoli TaxID=363840 RepID=A0ABU1JQ46_9PROT|nr:LysR family transcriptional regulator [Inquilinus ginsengisoli]MDR6290144.1 DNA-binding transcriptional LysR family regulator [Inquilinus ginsengisoli]
MELRHLRYAVALAEELHFSRAAARLGISQPPLSQQIQALEDELGARLFERTNRRVALTEVGRLFVDQARLVLAGADRAVEVARRAQRGEIGQVRIAFTASAPFTTLIPQTIFAFRQAYPDVHLELQEMATRQQIEALAERRLQVGFLRNPTFPPVPDTLAVRELFRDPLVVALRADHPLAAGAPAPMPLADLAGESFVCYPRDAGTSLYDQMIGLCRDAGFSPRLGQEAREVSTIVGLVAAGLGVSLLPASLQRIQVEGVVFRRLTDPGAFTTMWLTWRHDETSPAARAFIDLATGTNALPGGSR